MMEWQKLARVKSQSTLQILSQQKKKLNKEKEKKKNKAKAQDPQYPQPLPNAVSAAENAVKTTNAASAKTKAKKTFKDNKKTTLLSLPKKKFYYTKSKVENIKTLKL